MDFEKIQGIFCETITGLILLVMLPPLLESHGGATASELLFDHVAKWDVAQVGILLFVGYAIGLVFDAIGLACGEIFFDKLLCKEQPTDQDIESFWSNVSEVQLRYRNEQWAYYSFYRNLILLLPILAVLWVGYFGCRHSFWAFFVGILLFVIWIALVFAARALLKLYYKITLSPAKSAHGQREQMGTPISRPASSE